MSNRLFPGADQTPTTRQRLTNAFYIQSPGSCVVGSSLDSPPSASRTRSGGSIALAGLRSHRAEVQE